MPAAPAARQRVLVDHPPAPSGRYVLYWMVAHRRVRWNPCLEHAVWWARELRRPLIVFEPLGAGHRWACDRFHRFVVDGMADNRTGSAARPGVTYWPYVEPRVGDARGLLGALAADAAVVVTDDYPAFVLPHMVAAAARQLSVRLEAIDGNGLLPMRAAGRAFPTAYTFRRFLQQTLPAFLADRPRPDPLDDLPDVAAAAVPDHVLRRWPSPVDGLLAGSATLASLPIDHTVGPVARPGGMRAAAAALTTFLDDRLAEYGSTRQDVERDLTSRLSPYLHFGHIGSWEVVATLLAREGWIGRTGAHATGAKEGWWGVSPPAERFLDQIVTWRELGFNMCVECPETYDRYESLPQWALATLGKHETDSRTYRYELADFERGRTHDRLWNAAQGQLRREGRIHSYLRMLWGKKILEWSASPREALAVMVELNNKYALDGRDPNSYSGIFWTLGRYDRPWGPERPVFGAVRFMSCENTARKMSVTGYLRRYAPEPGDPPPRPALWT